MFKELKFTREENRRGSNFEEAVSVSGCQDVRHLLRYRTKNSTFYSQFSYYLIASNMIVAGLFQLTIG
jgi:hypothetical protein